MKFRVILTIFISFSTSASAQPPRIEKKPEPSRVVEDFKLRVTFRGVRSEASGVAELVFREGVCYQFLSEKNSDVAIIDWNDGTITLLDLDRRMKAVVTAKQIDDELGELYDQSEKIVSAEEKSKSRSDRVSAEISRPLIDPNFEESFDAKTSVLTLKNRSVTVVIKGKVETDDAKREAYASCLVAVVGLGAMRDPDLLPPFTRLDAFKSMMFKHKLRPAEVSFVYRLAGPPQKIRMTYEFVSQLSVKETEAIARIIKLAKLAREVTLGEFDAPRE